MSAYGHQGPSLLQRARHVQCHQQQQQQQQNYKQYQQHQHVKQHNGNSGSSSSSSGVGRGKRELMRWEAPDIEIDHNQVFTELQMLGRCLPKTVVECLASLPAKKQLGLLELYVAVGRRPEIRVLNDDDVTSRREWLLDTVCVQADIDIFGPIFHKKCGEKLKSKRCGIDGTLHRLSLTTKPSDADKIIAVTIRIGRTVRGVIHRMLPDIISNGHFTSSSSSSSSSTGKNGAEATRCNVEGLAHLASSSILLIGRPGVGKTTVLRELARVLSQAPTRNVVVVDKSMEIAGDGDIPHSCIGDSHWMPVGVRGLQASIMLEAVENQFPDTIIVDELSTKEEVQAARTIAQRGVQLIATVHGRTLADIIHCGERHMLVGGRSSVTLSDSATRARKDGKKQVGKRITKPVFGIAIEVQSREVWYVHQDVGVAVDAFLNGEQWTAERRTPGECTFLPCCDDGEGAISYDLG